AADKAQRKAQAVLSDLGKQRGTTAMACMIGAEIYRSHNQPQQAEKLLQRAALVDPDNTACRARLIHFYQQHNQPLAAQAFFEKLTRLQPKVAVNYFHLGNVHAALGQPDKAEAVYQKIIEVAPDQAEGYLALVHLYLSVGQKLPEARQMAVKAVERKPVAHHYFLLATVCHRLGDRVAGLKAINRAVELDARQPKYRQLQALLQPRESKP
ncbi:MAG: tetratricopeptide repeat protein, partial [Verrucomicrobiota bacterium]